MILADKILTLRKKNGLSQEELAEKLDVSRQSISKWEGAQSIPDIGKIIEMSKLFGVTLDFLLRDDIEMPEYTPNDETDKRRRISMSEANDYIKRRKKEGKITGLGVILCILSPVALIELAGCAGAGICSEAFAVAIGLSVLLTMVAAAVALFIYADYSMRRFSYLDKEEYLLEYGVEGMIREKREARAALNTALIAVGIAICILAVLPLLITAVIGVPDIVIVSMIGVLLAVVSIGVYILIYSSSITESFDKLLCDGEFNRDEMKKNKLLDKISGVYWPLVVVAYLGWSFISKSWDITWIVWPIAGVVFGAISVIFRKDD